MAQPQSSHPADVYDVQDDAVVDPAGAELIAPPVLDAAEGPHRDLEAGRPTLRWHLLTGGFGFPWTRGALACWLMLSAWAATELWLARSALSWGAAQPLGSGGLYSEIVALLTAMGAVLFGIACAAVAAIHGLTILSETSAGNDRVQCWPNILMFLEWAGNVLYVVNAAMLSFVFGCGVAWLAPAERGPIIATAFFVLFPILLLSELEANSAFVPVSSLVWTSLWWRRVVWLLFYVQSGGLLALTLTSVYCIDSSIGSPIDIVLAAMLLAAVLMIYFRLLGRLAWFCSVETDRKAKVDE